MEGPKLPELLEEDRETILQNLAADRSAAAAQNVAEKALDRVLYRYTEQCRTDSQLAQAQSILQAAKNALPLLSAVGEVREWELTGAARAKKRPRTLGIALGAAGLVLSLAAALAAGTASESGVRLWQILLPIAGALLLFLGGVLAVKPPRRGALRAPAAPEKRTEFLVEPAGVYRCLKGILLVADKNLSDAREAEAAAAARTLAENGGSPLAPDAVELFAGLLEAAYARRDGAGDPGAAEIVENIRYYLHRQGVETADYTKERQSWFELLPARRAGTMRPALTADGKLLKKGLASAEGI
jgi:hypothetical protein